MKKEQKIGITVTLATLLVAVTSLSLLNQESFYNQTTKSQLEWYEIGYASYSRTCTDLEPEITENDDGSLTAKGGGSCSMGIGHGWAHVDGDYIIFDSGKKAKLDEFIKTVDSYSISNCFDPNIYCMTKQWNEFKKSMNMA